MEDIYNAKKYVDVVARFIAKTRATEGRGAVLRLSKVLECHPTFVSQVLKGKADFSQDQAVRFCAYAKLSTTETEFFLNLVGLDRSGTKEGRAFFSAQLKRQRDARSDLKTRWQDQNASLNENEIQYFASWLLQMVHSLTQIPDTQSPRTIASAMGARVNEVEAALKTLREMRLVEQKGDAWRSTENFLHLSKDSPLINAFHVQWRQKVITDLIMHRPSPGLHYSGALTFSREMAEPIRAEIIAMLDTIMRKIKPSPSETAYALTLDFMPLLRD